MVPPENFHIQFQLHKQGLFGAMGLHRSRARAHRAGMIRISQIAISVATFLLAILFF